MKKLNIQKLYFNKASYLVGDNYGNNILLKVNYWENKFNLKIITQKDDNINLSQSDKLCLLEKEAEKLASDLLKRKSRINFAR